MDTSLPERIWYYGDDKELAEQYILKAGSLTVIYEKGSLRYIKSGAKEAVRMIYSAVRDPNWNTVEAVILQEKIEERADSFFIALTCEYKQEEIHFTADYRIKGFSDGRIRFEMYGRSLSSFKKNRIGFCVLHPLDCAGKACIITEATGITKALQFPDLISPHQPFKNIKSMSWEIGDGIEGVLDFEGDVFETEDQRNWTDASFKTYCTPLENPFPVDVNEGQVFRQAVEFKLKGKIEFQENQNKPYTLFVGKNTLPMPEIGIGQSSEVLKLSDADAAKIKAIGFRHYRIDIKLFEEDWRDKFKNDGEEAKKLAIPVFIALHLNIDITHSFQDFIHAARSLKPEITKILVFRQEAKTTPGDVIRKIIPALRADFPEAKIGAGTDAYFAELNRGRMSAENIDFVSFSVNPQVHAFDNTSLIETLEAQKEVVKSAQNSYPGLPIYISPVTLKPRFNPNATVAEQEGKENMLPSQVDVRQGSLFAAGWTLGSMINLAATETAAITYYETAGRKGLLMPETVSEAASESPFHAGMDFPLILVFKFLLSFSPDDVIKQCVCSRPLSFSAIAVSSKTGEYILIASHKEEILKVQVKGLAQGTSFKQLDAQILQQPGWLQSFECLEGAVLEIKDSVAEVLLHPFAIGIVFQKKLD